MFQYLSCKEFRPEGGPDTQKLICMKYKYPTDMPSATIINGNVLFHTTFSTERECDPIQTLGGRLSALTSCYNVKMCICCRGMFCSRDTSEVRTVW